MTEIQLSTITILRMFGIYPAQPSTERYGERYNRVHTTRFRRHVSQWHAPVPLEVYRHFGWEVSTAIKE